MEELVKELYEDLRRLNPEVELRNGGEYIIVFGLWPNELTYPEGYYYSGKYEITTPEGEKVSIYQW